MAATLQQGMSGPDVITLQQLLNQNGYSVKVTGEFDSSTMSALSNYQKVNGLVSDGVANPQTWSALTSSASTNYGVAATTTTYPGDTGDNILGAVSGAMGGAQTTVQPTSSGVPSSYEPIINNILQHELIMLDNIHGIHPETGRRREKPGEYLKQYTNRLFGAPFQLLDSADARFSTINEHVGTEYLRNFLLHSPILYIRPGRPQYTGGGGNENTLLDIFVFGESTFRALTRSLTRNTIFRKGHQLQRRMYGFRESYMSYMAHVNYMCRSVAMYLGLATGENQPNLPIGVHLPGNPKKTSGGYVFTNLKDVRWENYRMMNTYVETISEYLGTLLGTVAAQGAHHVGNFFSGVWNTVGDIFSGNFGKNKTVSTETELQSADTAMDNIAAWLSQNQGLLEDYGDGDAQAGLEKVLAQYNFSMSGKEDYEASYNTINQDNPIMAATAQKVKAVSFMVEPQSYQENLSNETSQSMIGSAINNLLGTVGSEISFITNSNTDVGVIGEMVGAMGGVVEGLATDLAQFVSPVTGGFMGNLFSGAIGALKGQKMIYPDIYKDSNSSMNYEFKVNLVSPYGDNYNYYMNIVVPLMHLIALAAPRLMSANNIASPFLVQAYIPGMCTCQLGIIESMNIIKNPNSNHVNMSGFPLSVSVQFTIKELYNSLAISSAYDPASFMFNETLNDYMSNLAGLTPGVETYLQKKAATFEAMTDYFKEGIFDDIAFGIVEKWEDTFLGYGAM